ncbi:hypothetical protein ULMA_24390 [Patiriisocius marinus]|uniref:Uncharacterized protein n=1 Tax=Patiriisocius marinus TaxID=1397112 RepID=A0A5J4J3E7_9FLAO|nr:hypothetical protein ULMA_24390 [Patiriisocius marinus]
MVGVLLLALTSLQTTNAQQYEECIIDDYDVNNFIVTEAQKATASSNLPVVFNVAFWQINDPNRYYPEPITEHKVLTVIAEMNKVYNQIGIFLKYRGLHEFNSPTNVINRQWIYDPDEDGYDGNASQETIILKDNE